ncbi:related to laccase precursor [Cephalotrichum gorgonifer]|uniref:Related to laccase n=1 Tax=Cephalotrichum gorgonifer TaxID=2041049 RepID=A0AAE8N8D3_9PEZI|nr:related to laccase precursor [Cephalotrichum gorgonifer]
MFDTRSLRGLLTALWLLFAAIPTVIGKPSRPCTLGPRKFELTLEWKKHAPDGFERDMILVNGQFPGPLLEITEGDDVEVLVHNKLPYNTTIHYHGIEMHNTPWSDGVPGLTQRQIQPGSSFTYRWTATQYGSYWYHAHQRGQINDGLYGPIIIHPRHGRENPLDLISNDPATVRALEKAVADVKPLVMSDLRHITSDEDWELSLASGIETPCYDSVLFNGKGRVNCWPQEKINSLLGPEQAPLLGLINATGMTDKACLPAEVLGALAAGSPTDLSVIPPDIFDVCTPTEQPLEVIEVPSSQGWVALDVIATFGLIAGSFSIDEHPVWIYAVDGAYIEPQLVEAISVTNGDRFSILVKLDKEPGDYTIRMASTAAAQMLSGYATLSYAEGGRNEASAGYINDVGKNTTASVRFFDQAAMRSFPPETVSPTADQTYKLGLRVAGASYQWALNNTIYPSHLDNENPILFNPQREDEGQHNVTISTQNGTWVDLVFVAETFPMPPHPIHKHGNRMWLIGQGEGAFEYASVAEAAAAMPEAFNFVNPPKRDGFATPPANTGQTWMAVRYHVTNPGAWFLHCHIQAHLQGGMAMVIQDGVDSWPTIPDEYLGYH